MKKFIAALLLLSMLLSLTACGSGGKKTDNRKGSDVDTLVSQYGYRGDHRESLQARVLRLLPQPHGRLGPQDL